MYVIMYIRGGYFMVTMSATNIRKDLFNTLENTIKYNEPVNVTTKQGNAVILSEDDYNGLLETLYLTSVPGLEEELISAMKAPDSEFTSEEEVDWWLIGWFILKKLYQIFKN